MKGRWRPPCDVSRFFFCRLFFFFLVSMLATLHLKTNLRSPNRRDRRVFLLFFFHYATSEFLFVNSFCFFSPFSFMLPYFYVFKFFFFFLFHFIFGCAAISYYCVTAVPSLSSNSSFLSLSLHSFPCNSYVSIRLSLIHI